MLVSRHDTDRRVLMEIQVSPSPARILPIPAVNLPTAVGRPVFTGKGVCVRPEPTLSVPLSMWTGRADFSVIARLGRADSGVCQR